MPEMFAFVGQKFRVFKIAHKTCDYSTAHPFRTRRLHRTVHLETRCDGGSHDGCQASCLLYWKEDWLKPVGESADMEISEEVSAFVKEADDDKGVCKMH